MTDGNLARLKKEYSLFEKKYQLPKFSELNIEFEIEKLQEHETDLLLREIRRAIGDKTVAFLKFFEVFLNPQAAPLFLLSAIKSLNAHDKIKIEKIYKRIVLIEVQAIALDIEYEEKKEAEFIKNTYKTWKDMKEDLKIIEEILSRVNQETKSNNGKSYFG